MFCDERDFFFADVRSRLDERLIKVLIFTAKNSMFSINDDKELIHEEMRKRQDNPSIRHGLELDLRPGFAQFIPELHVEMPCVLI